MFLHMSVCNVTQPYSTIVPHVSQPECRTDHWLNATPVLFGMEASMAPLSTMHTWATEGKTCDCKHRYTVSDPMCCAQAHWQHYQAT